MDEPSSEAVTGTPAAVAAATGYCDQAHLTREWRDIAGCTPDTWIVEELPSVQTNVAMLIHHERMATTLPPRRAHLALGGGVMLGDDREADDELHAELPTGDPDGLLERASGRGAAVLQGLKDEDFGSRGFSVKDPQGNVWTFGTYRRAQDDV